MEIKLPNRKSIRLKHFNYQAGVYFITICTYKMKRTLSEIKENAVSLTEFGHIIENSLLMTQQSFKSSEIHHYAIMPNHLHFILQIHDESLSQSTLSDFICSFKSNSTIQIIKAVKSGKLEPFDKRIWHRNYYEHVIRNEKEYLLKRDYIVRNPYRWEEDEFY
ncbi:MULTISPECIES: transposase [unclassified Fusibacter]|uniref:transposase n=1 Tax=unclassified Fusibacter TaxID=2624464 RepID=UPI0013E97ADA|nr:MULTISPECIES: transposase [unclassified Fusibacter]MCK8059349.1 transposase [Fusibacter sp. A2]NPE21187.1 transposase [Fusibacter sp. A1]